MKKYFLFLLLSFSLVDQAKAQIPLPQLQAGVFVNDSLYSINYCFVGYCDTLGDVIMAMDTNLISYVSGVQFKFIVTSLTTPPDSVYTLQNGILHQGDTLTFTPANNYFSFYASAYGCAVFTLIIVGTPAIPFENYPCEIGGWCTLSDCFNTCFIHGDTSNWCTVSDFSDINEPLKNDFITLSPNPFSNELNVKTNTNDVSEIILYDIFSKKLLQQTFIHSVSINTENFSKGIYFYEIKNKEGMIKKGKIVKE